MKSSGRVGTESLRAVSAGMIQRRNLDRYPCVDLRGLTH